MKPKTAQPKDPCAPWFTTVLIGKNKLSEMMKAIAQEGKLDKPVTNHSLRTYGVTEMVSANVPEKLMMEEVGTVPLKVCDSMRELVHCKNCKCAVRSKAKRGTLRKCQLLLNL